MNKNKNQKNMKKGQIFLALGATVTLFMSSCTGGDISTQASLKTEYDTLAYAYGVNVAEQGLAQFLIQSQVVVDTATFRIEYEYEIQREPDSLKTIAMRKALPVKLDSLRKANSKNMKDFMAGLNKGFTSKGGDDKKAYDKGLEIGEQLQKMTGSLSTHIYGEDSKEQLDSKILLAGIATVLKNEKPILENTNFIFESKMKKIDEDKMKQQHAEDIAKGEKFLADNKTKEGVVTLPSGLQYKVIKEGTGEKPTAADVVKVHYHGTLIDGTVFDSSVDRGEPTTFGVGQVIRGWTEALQLMPVGSKWQIYVPYDLGYGAQRMGTIVPFSTLIFDVELLDIEKK